MMHGANEADMVHGTSKKREVFTDFNTWCRRLNGLKFATNFAGCAGLHVPQVELAWAAEEEDEDAGFCRGGRRLTGGSGPECEQVRQGEPGQAESADTQKFTAMQSAAGTMRNLQRKHALRFLME
jgi:hypothetical protein